MRRQMLDGLLSQVPNALPAALERLQKIAKESEDEAVAVRAALGLWDIFGRVSDRMELETPCFLLRGALVTDPERVNSRFTLST